MEQKTEGKDQTWHKLASAEKSRWVQDQSMHHRSVPRFSQCIHCLPGSLNGTSAMGSRLVVFDIRVFAGSEPVRNSGRIMRREIRAPASFREHFSRLGPFSIPSQISSYSGPFLICSALTLSSSFFFVLVCIVRFLPRASLHPLVPLVPGVTVGEGNSIPLPVIPHCCNTLLQRPRFPLSSHLLFLVPFFVACISAPFYLNFELQMKERVSQ